MILTLTTAMENEIDNATYYDNDAENDNDNADGPL